MAAIDPAARRYATAAFELAQEAGEAEAWAGALDQIAALFADPDVVRVMSNSRVPNETKLSIAREALKDLPALTVNLAGLLIAKGRTALAPAIAQQFRELLEESQGIVRARARSAVPLSKEEEEAIARRLGLETGKHVILETEVDPSLIGGLVIQVGDRLVDASTRARLEALKENLVGAVG